MPIRLTLEEFINRSNIIHNNKYDYSLVDYKNSGIKVDIICPNHGIFKQKPNDHLSGHRCRKCGTEKMGVGQTLSQNQFIQKANSVHGVGTYDYSKIKYENSDKKIPIICHKHGIFYQTPIGHTSGKGCIQCGYDKNADKCRSSKEEFIDKSIKIHGDRYDYSLVNYVNSNDKVIIICKKHNKKFLQAPISHLIGRGCNICNESIGEKKISIWLDNNNINYIRQKTFKTCKDKLVLHFDFFLPIENLLIEFDGEQHFKPTKYRDGVTQFESIVRKDKIKDKWALDNGIKMLRIKYTDIKKIDEILKIHIF